MPPKILLVHHDTTLAHCYAEKLSAAGFAIEHAPDGESALARLSKGRPDAVLIDLVLPTVEAPEVIRNMRLIEGCKDLPIIALPCSLASYARSAQQAGATKVLERDTDSLSRALTAINEALGSRHSDSRPHAQVDQAIAARLLSEAPAWLALFRRSLNGVVHSQSDRQALHDFLEGAHHFTEAMAMADAGSLFQLAAAVTVLVGDLHKLPDQLNASTLRTLGQAADFLSTLLDPQNQGRARDLDASRVLIVEDDAAAGQLIQAAMQFVGLRSAWADAPAASLDRLAREPFDLIFLDVGLPQMSGFDLCTKVRTLELHEKTPIVFLTGMATFQNRVQSSLSGGNDFIGKPFNLPELGVKALIWVYKGHLGLS